MSAASIDDYDFEALFLEHVDAVVGDDNWIGLSVTPVEWNARFCWVLKRFYSVRSRLGNDGFLSIWLSFCCFSKSFKSIQTNGSAFWDHDVCFWSRKRRPEKDISYRWIERVPKSHTKNLSKPVSTDRKHQLWMYQRKRDKPSSLSFDSTKPALYRSWSCRNLEDRRTWWR